LGAIFRLCHKPPTDQQTNLSSWREFSNFWAKLEEIAALSIFVDLVQDSLIPNESRWCEYHTIFLMTDTVDSDAVLAKILAEEEAASFGGFVDVDEDRKPRRRKSTCDEDEDFIPGKQHKPSKSRHKASIGGGEKKKKLVLQESLVSENNREPRDEEKKRKAPTRWTEEEEKRFLQALDLYGRDWQKCAEYMGTRDANNFRSHAQKYFIRLYKQGLPVPPKVAESGQGHTLSGKPLDPNSAAARCYIYGKEYRKELASKRTNNSACKEKENQIISNPQEESPTSTKEADEIEAQMLMDMQVAVEEQEQNEDTEQSVNNLEKKNSGQCDETNVAASSTVINYDEEGKTEYTRSRLRRVRPKGYYYSSLQGSVDSSSELCFVETREYLPEVCPGKEGSQPFHLQVDNIAFIIMDFHAHLTQMEIIGFLGGYWKPEERTIIVLEAFPCRSLSHSGDDRSFSVEMDPESEVEIRKDIEERGLRVVGWYHSHPTFRPNPSVRDLTNQQSYQTLFRDHRNRIEPFVGAIVSPYDSRHVKCESIIQWFYSDNREPFMLSCSCLKNPCNDSKSVLELLQQRFSRCLQDVRQSMKMVDMSQSWKSQQVDVGCSFREKLFCSLEAKRPSCMTEAEFARWLEETLRVLAVAQ